MHTHSYTATADTITKMAKEKAKKRRRRKKGHHPTTHLKRHYWPFCHRTDLIYTVHACVCILSARIKLEHTNHANDFSENERSKKEKQQQQQLQRSIESEASEFL